MHRQNIRHDADTPERKTSLQRRILDMIAREGEVHNNVFSRYIRNITQSAINESLSDLESQGLIIRCESRNKRGPATVTWILP